MSAVEIPANLLSPLHMWCKPTSTHQKLKVSIPKSLKSVWAICVQPLGDMFAQKEQTQKLCVEVTLYFVILVRQIAGRNSEVFGCDEYTRAEGTENG